MAWIPSRMSFSSSVILDPRFFIKIYLKIQVLFFSPISGEYVVTWPKMTVLFLLSLFSLLPLLKFQKISESRISAPARAVDSQMFQ